MSKKRRLFRVLALLAVLIVGLKVILGFLETRIAHTRSRLLATGDKSFLESQFTVPQATSFEFVVGLPRPGNTGGVRGALSLIDGDDVVKRIQLRPENMMASTWLDASGYLGLIVGRNEDGAALFDEILVIGKTYTVKVDFEVTPPKETQLWLFYQQREIDR